MTLPQIIKVPVIIAAVLAITLQIQVTLFSSETYAGLRVGLGDLFLPFAGLYIFYSLLTQKTVWPQWTLKYAYIWLAGLFAIMTIAMVNGYLNIGFLSNWGFFNKYL